MARPDWKRTARLALKASVAAVVLWAVGRHVSRTWVELLQRDVPLRVEPAWLAVAAVLYLMGLTAQGAVFGKVLAAGPTPVGLAPAVRAYLISHLGKYVPGKAMVVVMRVGLLVPAGVRASSAVLATFYETFTMMASGALVAAVGFALEPRSVQPIPLALALGLSGLFLCLVEPRVFPRVTRLVTMPLPNVPPDALPALNHRLLAGALAGSACGWVLLGLSQVAVVRAVSTAGVPLAAWPAVVAGVAIATVAGFVVAVLPGGLGVREGVLMTTLTPSLGAEQAVIAALALRLTWIAAEVLAAVVLSPLPMAFAANRTRSGVPPGAPPTPDAGAVIAFPPVPSRPDA